MFIQNAMGKISIPKQILDIHLSVTIQHRMNMPEVCAVLQSNVREAVEKFTGLNTNSIHVNVVEVSVK